MTTAIELHLRLKVKAGQRGPFLAFLKDAIPYYECNGGPRVRLLQDRADPDRFIEIMEYQSEDDYRAGEELVHNDAVMRGYLERWRALLDGPPVVEVYRVATTECAR